MEKKIHTFVIEKGLLDPIDVVIDPLFTKKVMEFPNIRKLKPLPPIDLYDDIKDLRGHIQTFESHMHYIGAPDTIMC